MVAAEERLNPIFPAELMMASDEHLDIKNGNCDGVFNIFFKVFHFYLRLANSHQFVHRPWVVPPLT